MVQVDSVPTAFIEVVYFKLVNVAQRRSLAQLYVFLVLRNNGWFSILRVGIPACNTRTLLFYITCNGTLTSKKINITLFYIHSKVHDGAIVIWQVQSVGPEFLKIP